MSTGALDPFGLFATKESKEEDDAREQAEENLRIQRERLELEKKQLEVMSSSAKAASIEERRTQARRKGQASTQKTSPNLQKLADQRRKERIGAGA